MARNSITKSILSVIAITLAFIMLVGALGFVTDGFVSWDTKQWLKPDEPEPAPKIVDSTYIGVDEDGGNVYELIFADGTKSRIVAPKGIDGVDGIDGTNGKDGKDGVDGTNGKDGVDGTNGKDGTNGTNGKDGKDGVDGINGSNGLSIYELWLNNGNTGTESDFLNWLRGGDSKDIYYINADYYVRTQEDFEALYSSEDWLEAESVVFIGNGGTLQFTASNPITIPQTVKRIYGVNKATIYMNTRNASSGSYAFGYATMPTTFDYIMSGMNYIFDSNYRGAMGLYRCFNVINCTVKNSRVDSTGGAVMAAFTECSYLYNCIGISSHSSAGMDLGARGFSQCSNLYFCSGKGMSSHGNSSSTSLYLAGAFYECIDLVGCISGGAQSYPKCTNMTECVSGEVTI